MVVTYWTGPALRESLPSVLAQDVVKEVIVVDNGNPPSVMAWLAEFAAREPRLRLIIPGRNTGFAAGCNLGASQANGDYVALINPDCVLAPGTIGAILDAFEERSDAWLCGGRLVNPDGSEQRGGRRDVLTPWHGIVEMLQLYRLFPNHPYFRRFHLHESAPVDDVREVHTVSGAFMVMPRRIYERLGGMDDNLFLHFDDSDLCLRVEKAGGKVLYCGHVPIFHYRSTSDVSAVFVTWHKTRSTNYYFHKHFTGSYPAWFLSLGALLLWSRFLVMFPALLAKDLPGIMRRWRTR